VEWIMKKFLRYRQVAFFLLLLSTVSPALGTELGESLPEFHIETFDGNTFSHKTLAGKPALVVFWNTWCPVCRKELPEVSRLSRKFPPDKLTVLAVNTGMNDSEPKARAYWEKYGYRFPGAFDHTFEVGQAFGIRGVPTIFLFDAKGVAIYKQSRLPENLEERLRRLTGRED